MCIFVHGCLGPPSTCEPYLRMVPVSVDHVKSFRSLNFSDGRCLLIFVVLPARRCDEPSMLVYSGFEAETAKKKKNGPALMDDSAFVVCPVGQPPALKWC